MLRSLSSVCALFLVTIALAGSAPQDPEGGGANGIPDLSGRWIGKLKEVENELFTGGTVNFKRKGSMRLDATQVGGVLSGEILVEYVGGGGEIFVIEEGRVGNGRFWFSAFRGGKSPGQREGLPNTPDFVGSGVVKNNKTMKVVATALDGFNEYSTVRFSAKRSATPVDLTSDDDGGR
ncbi:MAG: hypothetical protein IPN34_22065 [Planctomycetes bacterium]|nr:hypothetical protein [Planctomycetota bacterium]